jgi:outer membrane protein assembly factor BamB
VTRGHLIVSYPNNGIFAFSTRTGEVLWKGRFHHRPPVTSNGVTVDGSRVFTGMIPLDLATGVGAKGWPGVGVGPQTSGSKAAVDDVRTYFAVEGTRSPDLAPRIQGVDGSSGVLLWDSALRRRYSVESSPVVAGGSLYVATWPLDNVGQSLGPPLLQRLDPATGVVTGAVRAPFPWLGISAYDGSIVVNSLRKIVAYRIVA